MKRIIIVLTAFLMTFYLLAEEKSANARKITVEDAVILATDNNITLKKERLSLDLLKKQKNSSWNSASPTISLGANGRGSIGSGKNADWSSGKQKSSDPAFGATASVNVNLTPAVVLAVQSAKLAYEAGEISYEAMVRSIELNVRKSFYSLLYSKENIAVQESALASAKQTYEANLAKYKQGRLSELDLLNAQYNYERKLPQLESLKQGYEISLDSFKQVLGLKLTEELEFTGNLAEAAATLLNEEAIQVNLDEIPDVKRAKLSVDSAKNTLASTRYTAWGPTFSAGLTATESFTNKTLSVDYTFGVSLPLDGYLPWSSRALNVANQKANYEKQQLTFEDTKTSAAIKIRSSYNTIQQAQAQLDTYEKNVSIMQRAYEMTLSAYNAGSRDLLALQTAVDNLATAKNTLQNQRFTIISAILDLENTLGVPFGTLGQKE
jgi:outer membrane protein TolC